MTPSLLLTTLLALAQPTSAPAARVQVVPDAASSIQREIDRQIDTSRRPLESSPVIRLPKGRFILKRPISFRQTWGGKLVGQGYGTVIEADFSEEDRGKPMIDLTGCSRFHIADLKVVGSPYSNNGDRGTPGMGLLMARKDKESAGFHVIERVHFEGRFQVAALANIASEVNAIRDCSFTNYQKPKSWTDEGVPLGGYAVLIANHNFKNLMDVDIGSSTMLELTFENCSFGLHCAEPDGTRVEGGAAVMIVGQHHAALGDIFFKSGGGGVHYAKAAIMIHPEGETGQLDRIVFDKMRWEVASCEYALYGLASPKRIIGPVMWRDCSVYVGRQFAKFNTTASNFGVERTLLVRENGRFKTFDGPMIEANRSLYWDIDHITDLFGWKKLVTIHKSASRDRFRVMKRELVELPDAVDRVTVEAIEDR